jgi:xylan 1,4-beta-xylosidase
MADEPRREAVSFRCDLREAATPLSHFWEHTVGSGHAALALRADWRRQLAECRADLGFRHVRFHGLLSEGMETLTVRQDQFRYCFFNIDSVFDFLRSIDMRPYVELSFMPAVLASGDQTVFHYRANVTPPKDYRQWNELIRRLAEHWIARYGLAEVREWFFEVWNEPNLKAFWTGSREDYFTHYRHTVETLKQVDPHLRVGGPVTSKGEWLDEFLDYCERHHLPVDFVSTHHYPNDHLAGAADRVDKQLAQGQRGVFREWDQDDHRRARGLPLHLTEWNSATDSRLALHDEPYTAAFVVKSVLEANGLVENYSFWTFSDLFTEHGFPTRAFHGGFGLMTIDGVPKPSYSAFELLRRLGDELLLVDGLHDTLDAWVARGRGQLTVMLTHHALPEHAIADERVVVELAHCPEPIRATVERIDERHANATRYWRALGEPDWLTPEQVEQLRTASQLVKAPCRWRREGDRVWIELEMPPQAVAAVTLDLPAT